MIVLKRTCAACPEQYEAFLDGVQVGYLRLRHGFFTVDFPDCGGEKIYEDRPKGDGIFDTDERDQYLKLAVDAIHRRISKALENATDVVYAIED